MLGHSKCKVLYVLLQTIKLCNYWLVKMEAQINRLANASYLTDPSSTY